MNFNLSAVAQPSQSVEYLQRKLAFYSDAWDLAEDVQKGNPGIVVLDVRSETHYRQGHITTARSFPHRTMTAETLAQLDPSLLYITYCDGIGCNGSTKGALKLAQAGFYVRELIGGLDFWKRDQHPVTTGELPGEWPSSPADKECGC